MRAFGLADSLVGKVAARSRQAVELVVSVTRLQTRFFARLNLAEVIGLSAILVTGFWLVRNGDASVGAVTAAALYFQRLFDPINGLLYLLDQAQAAAAALARLVGVADMPGAAAPTVEAPAGSEVVLDGVDFAYEPGHPIFHQLGLRVGTGRRVAVVGASGAGKTTVAKLVAGIHRPSAGSVTIGGVAPAAAAPAGGRVPVVLVTQEVHVFAGTLAEDLRLAAPAATEAELEHALATVGALSWLSDLPDGIGTVVGDGGHQLSTTQAQQLALARLGAGRPNRGRPRRGHRRGRQCRRPDPRGGRGGRARRSQRPRGSPPADPASTADNILVLDAGRLVDQGTHEELVAAGGRYAELWAAWSATRVELAPIQPVSDDPR